MSADDTSKHFKDEGQNSGFTTSVTQSETSSSCRFQLVRDHSVQGKRKDEDNSCVFHNQEGLEHIFHTAQKLSSDYSSKRQPNCETKRGQ